MGLFSSLFSMFGGSASGGDGAADAKPLASVEHNGFTIHATPYKEGGQYQTCGIIAKEIGGVMKEHRFVRADRYADKDTAVTFTLDKGRQIVDEQTRMGGADRLFDR
ncbi:MAG: HlyU family transcriptional regulator [Pseudorhodoplanes sp.]